MEMLQSFILLLAVVKFVAAIQCGTKPIPLYKYKNKEFNRTYIQENKHDMIEAIVEVPSGPAQCMGECPKMDDCAAAEVKPDEFHHCRYLMTKRFIPDIEVALQDTTTNTFVNILNIDECESGPCRNGGTCLDGVHSYLCECPPGYTGAQCQIDINECASNPCVNGGTCEDGVNQYQCQCVAGYDGAQCQYDVDPCANHTCWVNDTYEYLLIEEKMTWEASRQACLDRGYGLAWIEDSVENEDMFSRLTYHAWLAGTDMGHNNCYVWANPQVQLFTDAYTNWYSDQPNNPGDACVWMSYASGTWYDATCSAAAYVLCKRTKGDVVTSMPTLDSIKNTTLC